MYKSVFINCQEILCNAALEVLQVHYRKQARIRTMNSTKPLLEISRGKDSNPALLLTELTGSDLLVHHSTI